MDGYPQPGALNAYWCEDCRQYTVVVHRDAGVTPMFLGCRATPRCNGMGRSMMYAPQPWPDHVPTTPTHEWYLPSDRAVRHMEPEMRDHIERGGLELREVAA
jgi:hypothetical protein